MKDLRGRRFALISHEVEGATGFPMSFAVYLLEAGADIDYLKFPFFYSQTKSIWIEHYRNGQLQFRRRSWIRFFRPELLSFAKDFLWLMTVGWWQIRGADFVLVSNNLLGFAALILRWLGVIPRFTYLVVDYSPTRFSNPWVERIYVALDRLVATRADSVWTMSMAMLEGRARDGKLDLEKVRHRLAPMGNNSDVIFKDGEVPHDMRSLVFVGNPSARNVRADLLLEVAIVLRERGESFCLVFVGPGDTSQLRARCAELGLEDQVVFKGSIAAILDLDRYLSGLGIGLAPYDPGLADNFSRFADPAKIKTYLGCGLPVLTTDVPVISSEVERRGAGFVTPFSAEGFADRVQRLWQDYPKARASARAMGADFTYDKIFDRLLVEEGLV